MEEDDQARAGGGEGLGERGALGRHRQAVDAHRHRLVQRAALALEPVADEAADDGQAEAAARRGRQRPLGPRAAPDQRLSAAAGGARRTAEGAGHAARDRVVDQLDRPAGRHVAERARGDGALHRADAVGEAAELVEAEARQGGGFVICLPDQIRHGSMYLHIG